VAEVRKRFVDTWKDLLIDVDGLKIYTALDLDADKYGTKYLATGLRDVDKRRGWRGPIASLKGDIKSEYIKQFSTQLTRDLQTPNPALIIEISRSSGMAQLLIGEKSYSINLREQNWAKKKLYQDGKTAFIKLEDQLRVGDVVEISLIDSGKEGEKQNTVLLDQAPEIEGALVLLEQESGKVLSAIGGYSYKKSSFNRVTQALRQPGSTFKPVVYLAAVDGFQYTPATIVQDTPRTFRVGDEFWTPGNFDKSFLGAITLRTALEKSRNLVSADIVSKIGVDAVIRYARKLGIESPLGRNLSLALGSSEVNLLEISRAYGVLGAKGVLFNSVFITKIVNRDGVVIFDYEDERISKATQVISEESAFIISNMMKGVIERGTGYRVRELNRPVAGKTGTSNDQMDAWFIGYTPRLTCGVWVGFDQKKEIGEKETGGVVAAPIFTSFMKHYLENQEQVELEKIEEAAKLEAERLGISYSKAEKPQALDFSVPEGIDPVWVNRTTGKQTEPGEAGAIYEYFLRGTEPNKEQSSSASTKSYLESPDL
jgi:penicillin-binding protein 1A